MRTGRGTRRAVLAGVVALAMTTPALADGGAESREPQAAYTSIEVGEEAFIDAQLLVHPDDVPGAGRLRAGVLFDIAPGWHLYWRNPGDTGLPTELAFSADGAEARPVAWPAPQAFLEAEGALTTYGYSGRVLLASELLYPESDDPAEAAVAAAALPARVSVDAELLVCETECVPLSFSLATPVPAAFAEDWSPASVRRAFARAESRLPVEADTLGVELGLLYSQTAVRPGDAFEAALTVKVPGGTVLAHRLGLISGEEPSFAFYPHGFQSIEFERTDVAASGPPNAPPHWRIGFAGRADAGGPVIDARFAGVLAIEGRAGARQAVAVDFPLPRARAGAPIQAIDLRTGAAPDLESAGVPTPAANGAPGLGLILLLAVAGGLILNLMPCVLPVLAIKVFAVAELAHRDRREVLAHGAAYAAGILATMSVLGAAVLMLRAAGTAVGWGFQFQEPLFVAGICTVLVVFALNLFGVFEISVNTGGLASVGAATSGPKRSFFEGLLAVVLATPCSAPFLGTAVGFAFASSGVVAMSIFLAVGVGLALPFVLVTWVPGWSRVVPRGGNWMLRLRSVLGFCLLATAVWLLWVFGRTTGPDAMAALAALLLATSFAAWLFGIAQAAQRSWWARGVGFAAVGLLSVGFNTVDLEPAADSAASTTELSKSDWRSFQRDSVSAALAEGHPVFVSFSADWCITCKLNERTVIETEAVRAEFERLGFARFRADWTLRDEAIRAELARFGRAGVPLYLIYRPEAPEEPQQLPELLSRSLLVDALRAAAGGNTAPRAARPPESVLRSTEPVMLVTGSSAVPSM